MYKTYIVDYFDDYEIVCLITKAENIKNGVIRINNYLKTHFIKPKEVREHNLQELGKLEIICIKRYS